MPIKYNFKLINFLKKNLLVFQNPIKILKFLLKLYNVLFYYLNNNFKIFFFNFSHFNININILNLNFFNVKIFNKNFFWFFFKYSWLKQDHTKKKFLFFLHFCNVKFLFFFKKINVFNLTPFLSSRNFLLGGFAEEKNLTQYLDYPIFLNSNNLLHLYFLYIFFIKISIDHNNFKKNYYLYENFYFFNIFFS